MDTKLKIADITVAKGVIMVIVANAVRKVEGVASVDGQSLASGLISMFTNVVHTGDPAVDAEVVDDKLKVTVRVAAFFGYPFMRLADDIRASVAAVIEEQVGVEVSAVDVCIDNLVFPKE